MGNSPGLICLSDMADFVYMRDPAKQKRKNARVSVALLGEFRIGKHDSVHEASVIDVGTGGIGLTARTPLFPGDRILLAFPLNETRVEAKLVVSRSSGNAFGAVYENPEDPAIPAVQDYIQKRTFLR